MLSSAKRKQRIMYQTLSVALWKNGKTGQERRTETQSAQGKYLTPEKQELQKAQEAKTDSSCEWISDSRSYQPQSPVATCSKTCTDRYSAKPDMKRPRYFSCSKNAEFKAGKETVRTNIRQEQQVKSVARANQPNVAESISNHKKSTVQKTQVNQKQNRKTVTSNRRKDGRNEIKAYPYLIVRYFCPFLHCPLFSGY